jgi:hypothetical protein
MKFTHFSTFSLFTALSPSLLLTSLPNSSSALSRTSRHSLLVVLVVAKDACIIYQLDQTLLTFLLGTLSRSQILLWRPYVSMTCFFHNYLSGIPFTRPRVGIVALRLWFGKLPSIPASRQSFLTTLQVCCSPLDLKWTKLKHRKFSWN